MTVDIRLEYSSLADLAESGQKGDGSSHQVGGGWRGTTTYAQAVALANGGWTQGARTLADLVDVATPMMADKFPDIGDRITWRHTMTGTGILDVGAYTAGQPLMIVGPVLTADTPVVSVAMPAIWSATVDTDSILAAGAVAAAVVTLLTERGYSVSVHALAGWGRRGYDPSTNQGKVIADVILKASTDPLSMEDLAFGLAHPSMSRRFIFAAGETSGVGREINCWSGGGYGGSGHVWSGSEGRLIRGLADIDLTGMASAWFGRAGDLSGCVGVAVKAVSDWCERS